MTPADNPDAQLARLLDIADDFIGNIKDLIQASGLCDVDEKEDAGGDDEEKTTVVPTDNSFVIE